MGEDERKKLNSDADSQSDKSAPKPIPIEFPVSDEEFEELKRRARLPDPDQKVDAQVDQSDKNGEER